MKAKALLILYILLANLFVIAQNTDWEIHIGLSNRDEGARDLIEYYDNGYYIEGWAAVNGDGKGWNVKTNINGDLLWDNLLDHNLYKMYGWSVVLDNEGNRYISGNKFNNVTWPFLVKLSPCGEVVWCKILADDQLDEASAWDIVINENNEIVILCNYLTYGLEAQIYLECLDQNGEYLWKKQYAKQEDYPWIDVPVAYDVMEHNKEYYISGYCYWPFPSDTTHLFLRPLFIGIDSLFNEKWILPFYAMDSIFGDAYCSIPVNDSIILGVGIRRFYNNEDYSLLALYNTNGQEVSFNQITNSQIGPGIHSNFIKKEIVRIDDTLFLAASMFGPDYGINPGGEFVLDTAGNLYNFQSRPNTSSASLIKSSDNNFVLASTITETNGDKNIYLYKIDENLQPVPFDTKPYTYDSLCPEQIQSGLIDLSACMVWTGTEEIPSPEMYYSFIATIPITAFPNPAETEITLAFQNTEHHSNMVLECYNIYGQRVHSEKIYKGQQQTKLNVSGWSKGLYFAVVKREGNVEGMVRFVRR
jgi:hypothetical protein